MNVKVAKQTDSEVTFEVSLNKDDLAPTVRQVYNRLRADVKAPGFRPGKAPDNVVERQLGAERVQAEVIEAAAQTVYTKAVKEHKLTPIAAPRVELAKFVPYTELELKMVVNVMPKIKLADYKKFKKQPAKVEVSQKEISQVLDGLQQRAAKRSEVKRAAKVGDEVVIDFEGTQNGKAIAEASATAYSIRIGSGRLVPGFENNLVGLKAGGKKSFDVTFPADYYEPGMRGRKVKFSVKVSKVQQLELPKLDDAFAKQMGPFDNLAQLKADIEKQITQEKEAQAKQEYENALVGELVEKSKMALPPQLIEQELEHLKNDMTARLSRSGSSIEKYLKEQNKTLAQLDEELKPTAERRVKTALILSEVAKQEGLSVTPEELEVRTQLIKGQYQDTKMQEQLDTDQAKRDLANQLLLEKTVAKLTDYATKK